LYGQKLYRGFESPPLRQQVIIVREVTTETPNSSNLAAFHAHSPLGPVPEKPSPSLLKHKYKKFLWRPKAEYRSAFRPRRMECDLRANVARTARGPRTHPSSEWSKPETFEHIPEFRQGFRPGVDMTMRSVFSWTGKDYDKKRSGGSTCLLP
jgi:hypothetical protein